VRRARAAPTARSSVAAELQIRWSMPSESADSPIVLVVEDDEDIREMLGMLLRAWGQRVAVAPGGRAALAAAAELEPGVMLIDLGLPDVDGFQVAEQIRAMAFARRRPYLIALTIRWRAEDWDRAFASGFDRYLTKPVDATQLREAIALAR
jgi:CheY-like chemotaxis protein